MRTFIATCLVLPFGHIRTACHPQPNESPLVSRDSARDDTRTENPTMNAQITQSAPAPDGRLLEATARFRDWHIAYGLKGSGDAALVFVHGWGSDRSAWDAQLRNLQFDGRVVAVDLLGHGRSAMPEITYSVDVLADSVIAVLDDLDAKKVILVGHSAGVPVCRCVLHRAPGRVHALVAVDGPLRKVVPDALAASMLERLKSPEYRTVLQQMQTYVRPNGELTQHQIDAMMAATLRIPHRVLLSTSEAQQTDGAWTNEPLGVPLLAVYAKNPWWPFWDEGYETFVREIAPTVEYHSWEGASHLLHLERATEFNRLLTHFVERTMHPSSPTTAPGRTVRPAPVEGQGK